MGDALGRSYLFAILGGMLIWTVLLVFFLAGCAPQAPTPATLLPAHTEAEVHAACEKGDAESCALEQSTLETACSAGDGKSCFSLVTPCDGGQVVHFETPEARRAYLRKACDAEFAGGCTSLADLLEGTVGGDNAHSEAKTLRGRGCELGESASCYALGLEGLTTFCSNGSAYGCWALGTIYSEEQSLTGYTRDLEKSTQFHKLACELGIKKRGPSFAEACAP